MKPEFVSRRYLGITRSKGKMYELGLPEESHIAVPQDVEPAALFPLSIGTLMDVAASLNDAGEAQPDLPGEARDELGFAASFFDAYIGARFNTSISREVTLLASASYFLGQRPGSSLVLARRLPLASANAIEQVTIWVLRAEWRQSPDLSPHAAGDLLAASAHELMAHFNDGATAEPAVTHLHQLRQWAYANGTSREVVLVEVAAAVVKMRLASSAWTLLPAFSGLDSEAWADVIRRPGFPKELWPSQRLLGQAGLFAGRSGVIQMPTSAGKTRSVEVILRSAFLAGRTRVAVLVAPFRALCHEIATSMRQSFRNEDVKVNELSDALQLDFADQLAELFGAAPPTTCYTLVLTPEKLLYVLRQAPSLVTYIGLVVYDEGHQFDSGTRGITYELLLAEIKSLLTAAAQTVLISAVIKNATAVGTWLIGAEPNVVNGTGLLSTARSVAFATWSERLGQLLFFESDSYQRPDYFVPRSIEAQPLELRGKEKKARFFPDKGDAAWKDVSLYLGIRLAPNGAVAIFCGRKDTASGLVERAVEVYGRGFSLPPPVTASDAREIERLVHLASQHFGADSMLARAAMLGVFVHHGTTPQGLRLSVEYAMQHELIKLVICTSTLAQGVNLPIRYLIVSGVNQGADRIKTRDFQNLIGRAGRAGMHTEGLIVFADPRVIDKRRQEAWRLRAAVGLLQPENAEDTSSSLLTLVSPLKSADERNELSLPNALVLQAYFLSGDALGHWAIEVLKTLPLPGVNERTLIRQIGKRQALLVALESYLMANRGTDAFDEFLARVRTLAKSTLAFALATEAQKADLLELFERTALHIEAVAPEQARQARFSKTLLAVMDAAAVERWAQENAAAVSQLSDVDSWLTTLWPLLVAVIDNKLLTQMEPEGLALQLALLWMRGATYRELIDLAHDSNGTKAWGEDGRQRLSDSNVLGFVEGCLGFDCQLVVAAVGEFLKDLVSGDGSTHLKLNEFQKCLKYGLPDILAISVYESGFADRCIAQELTAALRHAGYEGTHVSLALAGYRDVFTAVLTRYPSYFEVVLGGL
jgi:POLQ-like helicase